MGRLAGPIPRAEPCKTRQSSVTTGEMKCGAGLINESDRDNSSNCICNIRQLVWNEHYGSDSLPGRNFVPGPSGAGSAARCFGVPWRHTEARLYETHAA